MHRSQVVVTALLLGLAPAGACSCEDDALMEVADEPGTCEPDFVCEPGFTYRRGACQVARCRADVDCCPGQRCSVAAGLCADQWVACTDDRACRLPGQRCIDFRGGRFCGYPNATGTLTEAGTQACAEDSDCPSGAHCLGERCLVAAPCSGGCPDAQVCDIDADTCFDLPTCEADCGPGQIRVVEDPETMSGEACCLVACACATLPPVPPGSYGWHASLAAGPEEVAVSAYDAAYGDLVVASFDPAGAPLGVTYVDGFPAEGPVVADPAGPRGGRTLAGPDVGEHTTIARDPAGDLHVAYYDRTRGALRYARRTAGTWTTHVVDDDGDVGRYTAIAVGPSGAPRISYMVLEVRDGDGPIHTGLRYAEARSRIPQGPADWTITEVDSRPKPVPPCGEGCARGETCVDLGAGPVCALETEGCGACDTDRVCVESENGPECADAVRTLALDDLPEGTGLFSSLVVTATGTPHIAYYDRIAGDLRLATGVGPGRFRLRTLDGDDPNEPTDVGAHASAALTPAGTVAVAYVDLTRDDLVLLDVASGRREIVDDGVASPDLRRVGADAALLFDAQGRPAVAYQDGTELDLVYARRLGRPPTWQTEVLRGAPPGPDAMGSAAGFYATQARVDTRAYVGSVTVAFDPEGNLELRLTVDVRRLE